MAQTWLYSGWHTVKSIAHNRWEASRLLRSPRDKVPRRGGEAAQRGFLYQNLWTVDAALDVIDGQFTDLIVEPLGDDGLGIDFILSKSSGRQLFHSVKRRHPEGNWTISRLSQEGPTSRSIIGDLIAKTRAGGIGVFCSGTSASDLEALIDHARASNSWSDFEQRIRQNARISGELQKHLAPACGRDEAVFAALKLLRVRTKNEAELVTEIDRRIRAMFRRASRESLDAKSVRLLISNFAIQSLGQPLTAASIRSHLASRGYLPSQLAGDSRVEQRMNDLNRAYITDVQRLLINGSDIVRHEAVVASRKLVELGKHVMLEGTAGGGKSCVVAQVLGQLSDQEVPCLVVRLDRLQEGHLSARSIGASLGLPESPALTLGEFSNGRPCVLCIDQLDALSSVSARRQTIWGPFNDLLGEVDHYPNMRLLFACRTFDLEQDPRFQSLVAQQERVERVSIGRLDYETIQAVVEAAGATTAHLSQEQMRVLATPLQLFLLLEAGRAGPLNFTAAGDLFDAFWSHKARAVSRRVGPTSAWTGAVAALCNALSEQEALVAPQYTMDEHADVLDAMASESVVQISTSGVQFFHESFFDYAFARTFLRSNSDLVAWLVTDTQHLFRRSQVRQVLAFLRSRETDRSRYLQTLEGLLSNDRIRFHIKKLVLDWMSELPDPTYAEWRILEGLVPELGDHAWSVIRNRVPWFDFLQETGRWAVWLTADDDQIERAIWLLGMPDVLDARSEVVAALVGQYQSPSDKWRGRLRWLAIRGHGYASREMQDLVIGLIYDGTLDDARRGVAANDDWWLIWYSTAREKPHFLARVLGAWFDRQMARATDSGRDDPFREEPRLVAYSQFSSDVIKECAARAPLDFVREMLPRFARFDRQVPRDWISAPSSVGSPEEQLRNALAEAMVSLASSEPEELDSVMAVADLTETTWMSALVLRAWSAKPEVYADRIVHFLLDRPDQQLSIGYSISNPASDVFVAISRTAVASASAHCSNESFAKLESAILHFTTARERRYEMVGRTELALLRALSVGRLTEVTRRRIRELEQRFPQALERGAPEPPCDPFVVSAVGPPVPEEVQRRMTDDEWLSAMVRHATGWEAIPDQMTMGGAIELSRGLQDLVGEEPERFTRLVDRMDSSLHPAYFEAILRGLSRSEDGDRPGTLSQVCAVLRRIASSGVSVSGTEMAHAIGALADEPIPDDILGLLCEIALNDADPQADDWQDHSASSEPFDQAINSARGAAAYAISRLLFADRNRWATLRPIVEKLARDPVLAVRTATVPCLLAVLDTNREDALMYFELLLGEADEILGARFVLQFVHFAMFRDYPAILPILRRMLESRHSPVAVAGARQIAIAALSIEEAKKDRDRLLQLGEEARTGIAKVCAENLAYEALGEECERRLRTSFADDSPAVRKAASRCWNYLEPDQIATQGSLIGYFAQTLAPGDEVSVLVHKLQEAQQPLPAEICDLAERAVVVFGDRAASIRFGEGGDAHELSELMVRLYEETNDASLGTRALDAIDDMVRAGFVGIDDRLSDRFDR